MRRALLVLAPAAAAVVVTAIICATVLIVESLKPRDQTVLGVLVVPDADVTLPILSIADETQLHLAPGSPGPGNRAVVTLHGLCPASIGQMLKPGDTVMVGTSAETLRYVVASVHPGPDPSLADPTVVEDAVLIVETCSPVFTIRALLHPATDRPSGRG